MINLILSFLISLITIAGLLWAFVLHVSNRQSQSYVVAAGYLVAIIAIGYNLAYFSSMHLFVIAIWLIMYGEIVRFYHREKAIAKFFEFKTRDDLKTYTFEDFRAMPLNEKVIKSGGRTLQKIEESPDYIVLDVLYEERQAFYIEADNYDFSLSVKDGYLTVEDLGLKYVLTNPSMVKTFKMRHPIKIIVEGIPTVATLILKKRAA